MNAGCWRSIWQNIHIRDWASAPSSEWRKGAFAPQLDNSCRGLKGKGPFPSPRRSLGPVLAPSGLRCGPRWAGGGCGEGGKGFFSSPGEKPTTAALQVREGYSPEEQPTTFTRQVREARDPEHSQGAPRTATVADDVKSLCPFGRRGEGHTCNTQQTRMQPTYGGALRIVPARRTKWAMKGI